MSPVEIYKDIDKLRDTIWNFNVYLNKEEVILIYILNSSVMLLKQLLCVDIQEAVFNFSKDECDYWGSYLEKFQKAVEARDDLFLYDCFNIELKELSCRLLKVLWKDHMEEIRNYFWHENAEVLRVRYPETLRKIKLLKKCSDSLGIREYGMRGRVLYIRGKTEEQDLYSEYNPNDYSLHVVKKYDLSKYGKVFIWTLGGDFDVGLIYQIYERTQINFEVYVVDIEIFGQFLHNVFRKGILAEKRIKYNFEYTMDDFLKQASMENNIYVYITAHSLKNSDEKKRIEHFLFDRQIDNNMMEERNEEYFICK